MKLQIVLTPDAHKKVAMGQGLCAWDFAYRTPDHEDQFLPLPEGYTFLADVIVELPSPEVAIHIALARLKLREQEIQAEACTEVRAVQEERAKLLSLTYNTVATTEFDDVPF